MNIGTLVIEMSANIARLQADMAQAKSTVEQAMKGVEAAVGIAKTAFIGLTGVASIAAFKGMIDGAIETKVELARLSQQTGASVESLSAIGAVAKATGTSVGDVASAMNKMQKSLATTDEDGRGAAQAIKALGLNFDDFKKLSPDEQMLQVAKAMDKFQDGGGKSAAAMLLWGKAGAGMLPMMAELAEKTELVGKQTTESARQALEYEKNMKQLEAAGNAWKRQMAEELLPSLVKISEAMVTARKEGGLLAMAIAGIQTALTGDDRYKNNKQMVDLTDQYMNLSNYLTKLKASGYDDSTKVVQSTRAQIEAVQAQINTVRTYGALLDEQDKKEADREKARNDERSKNGGVKVTVPESNRGASVGDLYVANLAKQLANLTHEASKYDEVMAMLSIKDNKFTEDQKAQAVALAKKIDQFHAAQLQLESFAKAEEAREAAIEAADAAFTDSLRAMSQGSKDYDFQVSLIGRSASEVQRLTAVRAIDVQQMKIETELGNARGAGLVSQEEYMRRLNTTQQAANDLKAKQLELMQREEQQRQDPNAGMDKALKDYQLTVSRLGDSWGGLMNQTIGGLEDRLSEFFSKGKADWKGYFQAILQGAIRLQVIRPMLGQIFTPGGGFAGAAGRFAAGGGFGGLQGAYAQTSLGSSGFGSGAAYGNMDLGGFFADGGRPPAGRPSVVGEAGPELFVPDSAGTVVPNGALGGTTVNFSPVIHIDARTDRGEVYSLVSRAMQENNQRLTDSLRQQGVVQ